MNYTLGVSLSIDATVSAGGTWVISNFDISTLGTIASATLTTNFDGDIISNGGETFSYVVNADILDLKLQSG